MQIPEHARGLLAYIVDKEANGDWNAVHHKSRIQPHKPITEMTVNEVLDWQRRSVNAGSISSAAGGPQFIRKTLAGLKENLGMSGNEKFTPELQSQLAFHLMERRGYSKWQDGNLSAERFANNLAHEWASLPLVSGPNKGRSAYREIAGNRALTDVDGFLNTIDPSIPGPSGVRQGDPPDFSEGPGVISALRSLGKRIKTLLSRL